jgi:hypothetical protein
VIELDLLLDFPKLTTSEVVLFFRAFDYQTLSDQFAIPLLLMPEFILANGL